MKIEFNEESSMAIVISVIVICLTILISIGMIKKYDRDISAFTNGYEKRNSSESKTDCGWIKSK